eukprot:TRINITY_DN29644_c0_g1_i1.p1 TRINITY_DN29644_c0_g1~~TRINITY_DN29644_c0_g1_i1.p1  ORF type:complete len:305 (+),score=47.78 TRINITY_DN29644_c0_g1_i1:27-941(+)
MSTSVSGVLFSSLRDGFNSLCSGVVSTRSGGAIMELFLVSVLVLFVLNSVTMNWSHMDRWWSIAPVVYSWLGAALSRSPRGRLMAALASLWGARLSFNFYRRGGYDSLLAAEDWRWPIIRDWPIFKNSKVLTYLFSFVFVAGVQSFVVLSISFPVLIEAHATVHTSLGAIDYIATILMLSFLVLETVADEQHWVYQESKWAAIKQKKPLTAEQQQGFCTTGLRKFSRHPNYFAEYMQWFVFYLFSVATTGRWLNLCIIGPIVLYAVIAGGTVMMEDISVQRYPDYKKYKATVSRFVLLPWSSFK